MKLNSWLLGLRQFSLERRRGSRRRSVSVAGVIERLESRRVLSITGLGAIGVETQLNSFSPDVQTFPTVAVAPTGNYVATWESNGQDGSGSGIFAQRYGADGTAVGGEFRVNTYTTGLQGHPSVAIDSAGDFVITWTDADSEDGSGEGVFAQRYSATGVTNGGEFQVNNYTTGDQENSRIAMDASGDFVITWMSFGQDASFNGVYARRYSSTGVPAGPEFPVNTFTTSQQTFPKVAMSPTGDFTIVWSSYGEDGSKYGIFAQRYQSSGAPVGGEFQVNVNTTGQQISPSVAMDLAGDFVVTWQSNHVGANYDVYARQFDSAGTPQGAEFRVNSYTTDIQGQPSVTMDTAGDFAVVWQSNTQDFSLNGVYLKQFNSGRAALTGDLQVNSFTSGNQGGPAIAGASAGDCVVAWSSDSQDFGTSGVYSQRFRSTVGPIVRAVFEGSFARIINPGDIVTSSVTSLSIQFSDDMKTDGPAGVFDMSNFRLTRNGVDVSPLFSGGASYANAAHILTLNLTRSLEQGNYQFLLKQTLQDSNGRTLDGEPNRVPGGDFRISFAVAEYARLGRTDFLVNTTTANAQGSPSTAMDALGNTVVVWSGNGIGDSDGIFGQRYDSKGVALGTEFKINTYTTGAQARPRVAMDPTGDFVVVWQSINQDHSGNGIYAQRFLPSGAPVGAEFLVNTTTTGSQTEGVVAMDPTGAFVIAWTSPGQDGNGYGVFARRYSSSGAPLGGEFPINTYTTNDQIDPSIAMDARGDFLIAWTSYGEDGSLGGVFGRMFDGFGTARTAEFRVNKYTTSNQLLPAVAADPQGDFAVAWESLGQDGDSYGIFSQRFSLQSQQGDSDFNVNGGTVGTQQNPSIAMDQRGDSVVAWESNSFGNFDVLARRFNAAGIADGSQFSPIGSASAQSHPSVAMDAEGDSVFVWQSLNQDGSGYGIYSVRYRTDIAPILSNIESTPLNAIASQNTPITATMQASDSDDTNWTGATIQIADGYQSNQDLLSIVNTAKITGTFDSVTGTMTLKGTDTVANYQTALRSVTYHNSSASPNTSITRTIDIEATDGARIATASRDLNVMAASNPAVVTGVSGTGTYTENGTAIPIASGIVITDSDSPMLASAQVTFSNWQAEDRIQFNNVFALQRTFSQNLTNHTAVLTITGAAPADHYQTLLRSVIYSDVSDNPNTSARVATFIVNDGSTNSSSNTRSLVVTPKNDAPVLSAIETTPLAYKANDPAFPAQAISATLLASDPDSANYTKATVQITAGYQNNGSGHDVLSFTNQSGITGSFDAATGTLTLTGTSSVSNYRTALRSVKFSSSGSAVSTAARTLTLIAFDNSSPTPLTSTPISRSVTVSITNNPPALTGVPATPLSYTRGSAAVTIAPALLVLDGDSINLSGATIQITGNYQNGQDVLAFTAGFGVTGSFNTSNGTLTLSGIASLANYQTLFRSVTYKTNTSGASVSARTIAFIANDGLAISSAVTRSVTLN